MQMEVAFLGHIVGSSWSGLRTGETVGSLDLTCTKQVRQFIGFVGYYRRFIQDFAGMSELLVALTDCFRMDLRMAGCI